MPDQNKFMLICSGCNKLVAHRTKDMEERCQLQQRLLKDMVTIPVAFRKKLNINWGTRLKIEEKNGKIIMEPLPDDIIGVGREMLKTKGKVLKHLLADRKLETEK